MRVTVTNLVPHASQVLPRSDNAVPFNIKFHNSSAPLRAHCGLLSIQLPCRRFCLLPSAADKDELILLITRCLDPRTVMCNQAGCSARQAHVLYALFIAVSTVAAIGDPNPPPTPQKSAWVAPSVIVVGKPWLWERTDTMLLCCTIRQQLHVTAQIEMYAIKADSCGPHSALGTELRIYVIRAGRERKRTHVKRP